MVSAIRHALFIRSDGTHSVRPVLSRYRRAARGFLANREPALADLLADPILQSLLASDGVPSAQLVDLIAEVKDRLAPHPGDAQ